MSSMSTLASFCITLIVKNVIEVFDLTYRLQILVTNKKEI